MSASNKAGPFSPSDPSSQSPRARVVFVADDLGDGPEIDRGVRFAVEHGLVRSVSLLVTGPTADTAGRWAASSGCAVGLHLAFCASVPVSPTGSLPHLAPEGALPRSVFALARRRLDPSELAREASRQLDRFVAIVGRLPDFVNTHQHAQVHPEIFRTLVALCERAGVSRVRSPIDLADFRPSLSPRLLAWPWVSAIARLERRLLTARGLRSPDGIFGGKDAGRLSLGRLDELWSRVPNGATIELVTHPTWSSPERVALAAPVLPDALHAAGLQPIDYRDV